MQKVPDFLGEAAKNWLKIVTKKYIFGKNERELLYQGAGCLDRLEQARTAILKRGLLCDDRYGTPKVNPAVVIERDNKTLFLKICRALEIVEKEGTK